MKRSNPKTDGFIGDPEEVFEEDQMGVRHLEAEDGSQWTIVQRDPFALWEIRNKKGGKMPEKLSGAYTSVDNAEKAIQFYLNGK